MIQFHAYPGGVKRAVTFSFDDGSGNDPRLIELFDRYGVKSTFHLNGKNYVGATDARLNDLRETYRGHEIACHTFSHGWPTRMPSASLVGEIMRDREILEKIAQQPVTGMSYPSGSYNDDVVEVMRSCGIEYSRTTVATGQFLLPDDFLKWHPSCHFGGALPCIERFKQGIDSPFGQPLLYIWGHSHELRNEQDWADMETKVAQIAHDPRIWYATNGEIYRYTQAQRMLKISVDEKRFYNPSALDVWVERNKQEMICIPAGQSLTTNE